MSRNTKIIKKLLLLPILWLAFGFLACLVVPGQVQAASANLVTNPGAESGSTTGWTITSNLGNGWGVDPGAAHSGTKSFETSYGWDIMNQKIDLLANGYTQNQLDTDQPAITFSNWMATRGDQGGKYFLTYKLLGTDGSTVIASYNLGTQGSPLLLNSGVNWFQQTYSFNSYGSGVRYVFMEIGGRDQSTWAGRYGTHFDDASITVSSNVSPNTPSSLGSASLVNGSTSANKQPVFNFTLADVDSGDTVKYQIQIDDSSDFSSPVVDYTSALAAQGSAGFTVGQALGSGSYTAGSAGQTLPDGTYYWRVKALDNNASASSYATANSGAVAFKVDTTAPSLTLKGEAAYRITQGAAFVDPGATATDAMDGDLTSSVLVLGAVTITRTGTYTLTYTATDSVGNSSAVTRTVTVVPKPVTVTITTASQPVVTSSEPATEAQRIVLNDFMQFFSEEGKALELAPNSKIYFTVKQAHHEEEHSITVKSVDGDTVTITIASTPFDVTMRIGEIKYVDVDKDGVNDISVKLLGVVNGLANVVVRQLPKPAASPAAVSTLNNSGLRWSMLAVTATGLGVVLYVTRKYASKKIK